MDSLSHEQQNVVLEFLYGHKAKGTGVRLVRLLLVEELLD